NPFTPARSGAQPENHHHSYYREDDHQQAARASGHAPMNHPNAPPLGAQDARPALRFDRNEISGAFGDIGTDFPLLVSMILIAKLDTASVLVMFGLMQIVTGLVYRMPMPVQPLKAMAVLVITQKLSGRILYGGGLAIGVMMLVLAATGLIEWVARAGP